LLLGRRIDPADVPEKASALLDEFAKADAETAQRFRPWLERTLQLDDKGFGTAQDAHDAFGGVADVVASGAAAKPADGKDTKPAKDSKKVEAAEKKAAA